MHPSEFLESILRFIKKIIPESFFRALQPSYHFLLAFVSALAYGFPSRKLIIIAVTGTNGKTTVTEIINAILEEAHLKTALSNTFRFKISKASFINVFKMTIPGRFFIQRFLRESVRAGCKYAVIELTSEGASQSRHLFISLNALIFTNLTPEHIEAHGSFIKYRDAKRKIAYALAHSSKKEKHIIANTDDKEGKTYLRIGGRGNAERVPYALSDAEPYELKKNGLSLTFEGTEITTSLKGEFNLYNILAAIMFARSQDIPIEVIKKALASFGGVPGRMEKIEILRKNQLSKKQDFSVFVDYAHTPDALEKIYTIEPKTRKICVLGATGGGRDKWKRPEMGKIAALNCDEIILTNEDPYDEDPRQIIEDIADGIKKKHYEIILDRRSAIHEAFKLAKTGDCVFITGKGTDPYIMGPLGSKIPWSDAEVAIEELEKVL